MSELQTTSDTPELSDQQSNEIAESVPDVSQAQSEPASLLAKLRSSVNSQIPLVKQLLVEYPDWLLQTFGDRLKFGIETKFPRLDLFVDGQWLQSCWFGMPQGIVIHFTDQGKEGYDYLNQHFTSNAKLGYGEYNKAKTYRFHINNTEDYALLKEITQRALARTEAIITPSYDAEALKSLIAHFQSKYKSRYNSFNDPDYLKKERDFKLLAVTKFHRLLSKERLGQLIADKQFERAKADIGQVCNRNVGGINFKLLSSENIKALVKAPAKALITGMFDLLYGTGDFNQRFNAWVEVLYKAYLNWHAATLYLMLLDQTRYLLVKPAPMQQLFKNLNCELEWEKQPNADFYQKLLLLGQELLKALKPLGARDMIDVQSFIWIVEDYSGTPPVRFEDTDLIEPPPPLVRSEDTDLIDPSIPSYVEPPFEEICQAIAAKGMRLPSDVIRRYHLALKTRGFVILSGISGTGKTWLTENYANAVGAKYCLVAVAPNWTTNEDLLGYLNPLIGEYR
ncbi:MAG: hypothetical protein WCS37_19205 [Chloroflexota bacterium]